MILSFPTLRKFECKIKQYFASVKNCLIIGTGNQPRLTSCQKHSGPKSFQDLLTLSGPTLRGKCLGTTGGKFLLPALLQGVDRTLRVFAFLSKVRLMCWSVNRKAEFVSPSGGMSRIFLTFFSVPCSRCAVPHPPLSWFPLSQLGEGF